MSRRDDVEDQFADLMHDLNPDSLVHFEREDYQISVTFNRKAGGNKLFAALKEHDFFIKPEKLERDPEIGQPDSIYSVALPASQKTQNILSAIRRQLLPETP